MTPQGKTPKRTGIQLDTEAHATLRRAAGLLQYQTGEWYRLPDVVTMALEYYMQHLEAHDRTADTSATQSSTQKSK